MLNLSSALFHVVITGSLLSVCSSVGNHTPGHTYFHRKR